MSKILVMGGSRGIGLETVKAALEAGHTVRAFARSAHAIAIDDARLEKFDGDALDANDVRRALDGMDCVVQALGASISPETLFAGTRLFSDATRILIDAMSENGPKRLVTITGFGAGDSRSHLGGMFRLFFAMSLKRIYDDKDVQERMIRASGLDWTILRPGILRDGRATGLYRVLADPADWKIGPVQRADVALAVLDELETGAHRGKAPVVIA